MSKHLTKRTTKRQPMLWKNSRRQDAVVVGRVMMEKRIVLRGDLLLIPTPNLLQVLRGPLEPHHIKKQKNSARADICVSSTRWI